MHEPIGAVGAFFLFFLTAVIFASRLLFSTGMGYSGLIDAERDEIAIVLQLVGILMAS